MLSSSALTDSRLAPPREALLAAANRFGTPLYVVDLSNVATAAAELEEAFPAPWVRQYSLKANDLPGIVEFLAARGWGANVVSRGEWRSATQAGVTNDRITLEGIGKTDADLEHAIDETAAGQPPRWLAVESPEELEHLTALAIRHRLGTMDRPPLDVLLRLNPDVDPETLPQFAVGASTSKFGMTAGEIRVAAAATAPHRAIRLRGVHVHTGSALRDVAAWTEAAISAVRLNAELAAVTETADTVDVGGGFPLPGPGVPGPRAFAEALFDGLAEQGLTVPARVAIEPGRYLVGGAGWLVSRVLHSRPRGPLPQQTVLDAGMTELMRPALYGSRHEMRPLQIAGTDRETVATSVEGPICESTDTFGVYDLPRLRRGDLVTIAGAGAYAGSFTSRYNGRPQPAEVLLHPDGSLVVAPRP